MVVRNGGCVRPTGDGSYVEWGDEGLGGTTGGLCSGGKYVWAGWMIGGNVRDNSLRGRGQLGSAAAYYSFAMIRLNNRNTFMVMGYSACIVTWVKRGMC